MALITKQRIDNLLDTVSVMSLAIVEVMNLIAKVRKDGRDISDEEMKESRRRVRRAMSALKKAIDETE